jgi:4-alpha-glucanotransferase
MSFPRASGILLHPTSLPSRGGIGDFGPAAYSVADFLASARQSLWQVLPLGPLGYGNSPYSSTSAFAGNPLLISLERLADHGWIDRSLVDGLLDEASLVDYAAVFRAKMPLLFKAAHTFIRTAPPDARARYENFSHQNRWWLEDFVLFDGLRARFKLQSWNRWPRELAHREPLALEKVRAEMSADLDLRYRAVFFL